MEGGCDWDVLVAGGGVAGCSAALALARRGVRVALCSPPDADVVAVGESVPPDTRVLLQQLGLWERFQRDAHRPCPGSWSSWGNPELGYNDFVFNPHGAGWHLDRRVFDRFLENVVLESGVTALAGRVVAVTDAPGGHRVAYGSEGSSNQCTTRFLVDATGSRGGLARHFGARRRRLDRLVFVYGFFELADSCSFPEATLLEAVEHGWWYGARLPGRRLAVSFAGEPGWIADQRLHTVPAWLGALLETRHFPPLLDACRLDGTGLVVRGAPSFLLEPCAGPTWLAIGDAAASFDPLAAQGIYKALSDGLHAAGVVQRVLARDASAIPEYQRRLAGAFAEYLAVRNHFYATEKRWSDSRFWRTRVERSALED